MSSKETADDVLAKLKELMCQITEHMEPIISRQKEEFFEGMDNTDVAKVLGALSFSLEAFVFRNFLLKGLHTNCLLFSLSIYSRNPII